MDLGHVTKTNQKLASQLYVLFIIAIFCVTIWTNISLFRKYSSN